MEIGTLSLNGKDLKNFVNNNKDIDEILIGVQNNKELKEILNIQLKRKILMSKELLNPSLKLIDPTKW